MASPFPGLRAVEALATSIPLFLLLFAATYDVMGAIAASSFNQPMTRTNALYFTVTVFATVGFGDITAKTETARLLVTGQMIIDLIILGIGARVILGAVQRSRQRQPHDTPYHPARPVVMLTVTGCCSQAAAPEIPERRLIRRTPAPGPP